MEKEKSNVFHMRPKKVTKAFLEELVEDVDNIRGLATILFYKNDTIAVVTSDLSISDHALACKMMDEDFHLYANEQ